MNVVKIAPCHTVDDGKLMPFELYVTEERKLSIVGACVVCGQPVCVNVPLSELYDECPAPASLNVEAERLLMHSLGIKPDEEAA